MAENGRKQRTREFTDEFIIGEFCTRFARWPKEKQAGTIFGLNTIHRCQQNGESVPVEAEAMQLEIAQPDS